MISCFDEFDTFLFWLQPIAQQRVMFPWSLSQGWQLAASVSTTTTITVTITITRAEERPLIRR